jgi:hypothetical protein
VTLPDAYGVDGTLNFNPGDDAVCKTAALSQRPDKVAEADAILAERERARETKVRPMTSERWRGQ